MTDRDDRLRDTAIDPATVFGKGVPYEEAGVRRAPCPTCGERTEQRAFRPTKEGRRPLADHRDPLIRRRRPRVAGAIGDVVWLCTDCGSEVSLPSGAEPAEETPAICQFCGQPLQNHSPNMTCAAWNRI